MTAEIHQLKAKPITVNWMCSSCGVDAGCNCGAPLMSKAKRAAEAIAANPQKSDRAIAEDLGVGTMTVNRARKSTVPHGTVDDEPRVGLDGKQRRMPVRRDVDEYEDPKAGPLRKRDAFLVFSNEAMLLARYEGPVDAEVIEAAKATASAWSRLVSTMEQGNG